MADILDIVDPIELTGFVRELIDANYNGEGSLARYLPAQFRLVTEYEFNTAERERPEVGRYRAFDAESGLQARPGFSKVRGSLPPISEKMLLSEADRTRLEVALRSGDTQSRYLRELVFNDAERLTTSILARVEQARGKVLTTGTVTFNSTEAGFLTTVDYNDGASAIQTNAASPLWSDTGSGTPIVNMHDWMEDYRDENLDAMPVVGLTSRRVLSSALATDEVKDYFTFNGVTPSLITDGQFGQLLSIQGIPPLVEYTTRVTVAGTSTRVIPDNVIVWLPAASVDTFGETMFGVASDSLDLVEMNGLPIGSAPGLTGRAWKTIDPPQQWTRVGGLVLPVLKDPKRIMVSTVLA
jgi:hypothetical protein